MKEATPGWPAAPSPFAGSEWFDPLEEAVRSQVRAFIEALLEEELAAALGRGRYERVASSSGRRHGHRPRQLVTTFGPLTFAVPRARLADAAGEREWSSTLLPAYRRLSRRAERLIAAEFKRRIKTQCLLPCAETAAAVLGAPRLGSDHLAPGRRLAHPRALTHRA